MPQGARLGLLRAMTGRLQPSGRNLSYGALAGTPNEAITASLVRPRLALGPPVPTLRRLTRAPSIKSMSASASRSGCDAPAAPAEICQTVTLANLELLDYLQARMTRFGQFDRGVREVAAALVLGDEFRRLLDEAVELANRIARARGFDLGPNLVGLFPLISSDTRE